MQFTLQTRFGRCAFFQLSTSLLFTFSPFSPFSHGFNSREGEWKPEPRIKEKKNRMYSIQWYCFFERASCNSYNEDERQNVKKSEVFSMEFRSFFLQNNIIIDRIQLYFQSLHPFQINECNIVNFENWTIESHYVPLIFDLYGLHNTDRMSTVYNWFESSFPDLHRANANIIIFLCFLFMFPSLLQRCMPFVLTLSLTLFLGPRHNRQRQNVIIGFY